MSQFRPRQITRLEKRALPYIARKQQQNEERLAASRERAFIKVANIVLLLLYGDPRIGELTIAWRRWLECEAWKACRTKHSDPIRALGREATPFSDEGARSLAEYSRQYILPDLSGADETEKLKFGLGQRATVAALVHAREHG